MDFSSYEKLFGHVSNQVYAVARLLEMHQDKDLLFDTGLRLGISDILSTNVSMLNDLVSDLGRRLSQESLPGQDIPESSLIPDARVPR